MSILYIGIDLAKNVFAVHGVNDAGKAEVLKPAVPRARLGEVIAALPPCTIGMEACSGAHHWARLFQAHDHTVKLMAPKFVVPHRLSGKKGKNDAAELSVDPRRPEDGLCLAKRRASRPPRPARGRDLRGGPAPELVGNANEFRCGRQLSAWLGLVTGQYSSGGRTRLGSITKAGDAYPRSLVIMGARALLHAAKDKSDSVSRWAVALAERRGYWRAVVAIAAKNARMAWAVRRRGEQFAMPA